MNEGHVKSFDSLKGFGFITRVKGKDLFFHYSDIGSKYRDAAISSGILVRFEIDAVIPHRARNVEIIS